MCFKRKQTNLQDIKGIIIYPTKEMLKTYALNYFDRLIDNEFNDLIETMRNTAIDGRFSTYYEMPYLFWSVESDLPPEVKDVTREKIKQEIKQRLEALNFTVVETTFGSNNHEALKISWDK